MISVLIHKGWDQKMISVFIHKVMGPEDDISVDTYNAGTRR